MTRNKTIGWALVCALILSACGSKDNPDPNPGKDPEKAELTITSESQTLSSDGGSATVSFSATRDWTATANVDWIVLGQTTGGPGKTTITVTVKKNEAYDQRDGLVVISSGGLSKSAAVIQKQLDALLVTSNSIILDGEGGTPSFEVQSNIEYDCKVEDDARSWISIVSTRGLVSTVVTLDISENTEPIDRQGNVIVYSGQKREVVTVYQKAGASGSATSLPGTSWYFEESTVDKNAGTTYNVIHILSFRTDGTFICSSSRMGMIDKDSSSNTSIEYYFGTYSGFNLSITGYRNTYGKVVSYYNCDLTAEIVDNVLYLFNGDDLFARFFKL